MMEDKRKKVKIQPESTIMSKRTWYLPQASLFGSHNLWLLADRCVMHRWTLISVSGT